MSCQSCRFVVAVQTYLKREVFFAAFLRKTRVERRATTPLAFWNRRAHCYVYTLFERACTRNNLCI